MHLSGEILTILHLQYGLAEKQEIEHFIALFDYVPNNTVALSVNTFTPIEKIPNLCDWLLDTITIRSRKGQTKKVAKSFFFKNEKGKLEILNKSTYLEKCKIWQSKLSYTAFEQRKKVREINYKKIQKEKDTKKDFAIGQKVNKGRKKGYFKKSQLPTFQITDLNNLNTFVPN